MSNYERSRVAVMVASTFQLNLCNKANTKSSRCYSCKASFSRLFNNQSCRFWKAFLILCGDQKDFSCQLFLEWVPWRLRLAGGGEKKMHEGETEFFSHLWLWFWQSFRQRSLYNFLLQHVPFYRSTRWQPGHLAIIANPILQLVQLILSSTNLSLNARLRFTIAKLGTFTKWPLP